MSASPATPAGQALAIAELQARLRSLGPRFDGDIAAATRALYKPHLDLSAAGLETIDVSYGEDPRHRLDLYEPAAGTARCRAVLVFIHGGGFVGGDKNGDGAFYVNVGRWLARQGLMGVLPNYRLAPAHPWPAGARDVGAVLAWAARDPRVVSARAGGAPLVVLGQSAGASHVASWLFDAAARGDGVAAPETSGVSGVMLMSGFYRLAAPLPAGPRAYFGDDASAYERRAPLAHVKKAPPIPVALSLAEFDPAWIATHTFALAEALTAAGDRSPPLHWFAGHNHVSTVQSLGSAQRDAGDALLGLIERWR